MSLRGRFFAATYDRQMKKVEKAGLATLRAGLLANAAGRVLEIGGGTGANLKHYGPSVEMLTITEPEFPMLKRLERRVRADSPATMVLRAPAEDLPFDDETFDVVVSTLVLCGVDDQPRALREIRRVLVPDGRLLFLEHVRSTDPKVAKKQDRLNWANQMVAGCDCNRPTLDTIRDAGFAVTSFERAALPKVPSFVSPTIVGTATSQAGTTARPQELNIDRSPA